MSERAAASKQTTSLWMDTAEMPTFEPLLAEAEADVCIIGAGIVGLTAAYLLGRAGRRVIVLEAGEVGGGNTGRTTAHLSNELDERYCALIRLRGVSNARLAFDSHTAAIGRIEAIAREEEIDCDFERVDGYLFLAPGDSIQLLDDELKAAQEIGWTAVQEMSRAPVRGFESGPCLRFPGQAQFHPLKYVRGLCRAIGRDGGRLHARSRVARVTGGETVTVTTTGGGVVRAAAAIVATSSPICDRVAIHTKQAPYTTYVLGIRVEAGRLPHALYWDTADPYHYVRLHPVRPARGEAFDVLIVGGEDHKTGQADDGSRRFGMLEAWARERFEGLGDALYRWSGMVFESLDGVAYIGPDPAGQRGVYVATGDSGMGMTHGTVAGVLLRDQILGVENAWSELYDPRRRPIRAAGSFVKENLNVALQYMDWLTDGEVESTEQIHRGQGALVRRGLHKIAVYRDEEGVLHACSAVCPHMHGPVSWNSTEGTWDCPCHGSRFDRTGRVIGGPASADLKPLSRDLLK